MVNPEEVLQSLDEFSKLKPKDIPRELEEYLMYVAKTGDPVYQWSLVKCLFREKMLNVITDFYESCPSIDLPPCPNVDPFNYETMKASLLERLESFSNAPFTVQRLCELLTTPRKEYTRVDKFMRAIEKNILVVSTKEPGSSRSRPDAAAAAASAPPQQQQQQQQPSSAADVLMNGVMEGRAGGLDIGEAIETVSADGVNLLHGAGEGASAAAAAATEDVALGDTIRVECEDIEMEDASAAGAVVWDSKAGGPPSGDGLKGLSVAAAAAAGATIVWESKDQCTANGEGLKIMDTPDETSTVWDGGKDGAAECVDGLKASSPPPPDSAPADEAVGKPAPAAAATEDEEEEEEAAAAAAAAAAVAVVSEFLTPNREAFAHAVELTAAAAAVESAPLVLAAAPDSTPACEVDPDKAAAAEEQPSDSKEEPKEEAECEDASQVDAESGISCSADSSSSSSSDCATAEMNQTLETNGTLEMASVESEVMSPLEDSTSNISPPSPDTGDPPTPPPTFAEMTADEDTQDAVRSTDPPDDDDDDEEEDGRGSKAEKAPEPPAPEEDTKMEVDEAVEQCASEAPTDDLPSQTAPATQQPDSSVLPFHIV